MKNSEVDQMRAILKDFHNIERAKIWRDFIINTLLSWPLFFYTCHYPNILTFLISVFFLYRGTMLIHEVAHFAKNIPGYRLAYNMIFGWATSYPAYIFNTHLFHHGKATYSTKKDPEYKSIEHHGLLILTKPIFISLILPFFQIIRFGLIPLAEPFFPQKIKLKILQRISTLVFDTSYVRPIKNEQSEIQEMVNNDFMSALYKVAFGMAIYFEVLPLKSICFFYLGFVLSSSLNMYRALFNHLYHNQSRKPLSWEEHLLDTTTIEWGYINSIIFVNGLNYHSLHHLFPELPYYNLKRAHKKLMEQLPEGHIYKRNIYQNIFSLVSDLRAR